MIEQFAENLPHHAVVEADMRSLSLPQPFDGLLAWDSFHLTQGDQRAMFRVFRHHAVPGAPLMFTSGPKVGEVIGELEGEPLYHASLARPAYAMLLKKNGFSVVAHIVEDVSCGGRTVWLARRGRLRQEH